MCNICSGAFIVNCEQVLNINLDKYQFKANDNDPAFMDAVLKSPQVTLTKYSSGIALKLLLLNLGMLYASAGNKHGVVM